MSDVRLTATNPEDSSVVPVACNAKGELKLEEPIAPPEFDGNLDGDLTVTGSATFGSGYKVQIRPFEGDGADQLWVEKADGKRPFTVTGSGSASFAGDVVVFSRSKQWMLVEQGGLCHMVEQESQYSADPAFSVPASTVYPKLRDVFAELDVVEKALEQVMEKLRMVEPDGWPVWDGSDNS